MRPPRSSATRYLIILPLVTSFLGPRFPTPRYPRMRTPWRTRADAVPSSSFEIDEQMIRMRDEAMSMAKIGRAFNISRERVRQRLARHGRAGPKFNVVRTAQRDTAVMSGVDRGESNNEIARALNISTTTVTKVLRRIGRESALEKARAARREDIRERLARGESLGQIAADLNVSSGSICYIATHHGMRTPSRRQSPGLLNCATRREIDAQIDALLEIGYMRGGGGKQKPVEQIDAETGAVIRTFPSGVAASQAMGCTPPSISRAALGRRRTIAGFKWRYAEAAGEDVDQYEARNPLSQAAIAEQVGCSQTYVALRRAVLDERTRTPTTEERERDAAIREGLEAGKTQTAIAAELSVTRQWLSRRIRIAELQDP